MANVQDKAACILWFFEIKYIIKMQRHYGTQCGKDPPLDSAV
jgi:hypothetical protein